MTATPQLSKSVNDRVSLSEQEQKAIQFAILTANQNTIIGQFFSQSTTFLSFILFICIILTVSAVQIFTQKTDSSQRVPGLLSTSYFKTDVRSYFSTHQLETLRVQIENTKQPHRFELYRCASEPHSSGFKTQRYQFNYQYNAQESDNYVRFSVPARSQTNSFLINIDFDTTHEQLMTDKLCIEKDVYSNKRHDDDFELLQNNARQQVCVPLLELTLKTPKEFINLMQCNGDQACTFRAFLSFERSVEQTFIQFQIQIALETLLIGEDCWYCQMGRQSNWKDTPWLLLKPLATSDLVENLPNLCMRYQSIMYQYSLQIFIVIVGASVFSIVTTLFCSKKRQYEEKIRQKALQEIRTKQKVHSHLTKMKTLMKKG